jgi:hypothetical protein
MVVSALKEAGKTANAIVESADAANRRREKWLTLDMLLLLDLANICPVVE